MPQVIQRGPLFQGGGLQNLSNTALNIQAQQQAAAQMEEQKRQFEQQLVLQTQQENTKIQEAVMKAQLETANSTLERYRSVDPEFILNNPEVYSDYVKTGMMVGEWDMETPTEVIMASLAPTKTEQMDEAQHQLNLEKYNLMVEERSDELSKTTEKLKLEQQRADISAGNLQLQYEKFLSEKDQEKKDPEAGLPTGIRERRKSTRKLVEEASATTDEDGNKITEKMRARRLKALEPRLEEYNTQSDQYGLEKFNYDIVVDEPFFGKNTYKSDISLIAPKVDGGDVEQPAFVYKDSVGNQYTQEDYDRLSNNPTYANLVASMTPIQGE